MKNLKINKFFTTPLGSFLKLFLGAMIVFTIDNWMKGTLVWPLDKHFLHAVVKAGLIPVLPIIYNWFNPNYQPYGKKPKLKDLPADKVV